MSDRDRLVDCPTCGRAHPAPAGAKEHYCSIACYRFGQGLDDPATGDGRRWCGGCQRYIAPGDNRRWCSDACRVAEWRRRQPPLPPSTSAPRRRTKNSAVSLAEAMTDRPPAPYASHDSAAVIDEAVVSLAMLRGLPSVGDAAAKLHSLASLAAQIDVLMPAAIFDARDQEHTWGEIAALASLSRDRVQRLAAQHADGREPLAD